MEAIQHSHLMHTGVISGDDEMMDSDFDQTIQPDDDYDIELDGTEVYSNTGDEEMKFDMGEETITYDNDDVMLDEGEYQTGSIQEEMIITEVPSVNAPFSGIETRTTNTTEIDHTHIAQAGQRLDSSADLPDTQTLSQASTQDIHADPFMLSQHVPGIVVEVPNSPLVDHQEQEAQEDTTEIAENTQQELHAETQEDAIHSSNENQPGQLASDLIQQPPKEVERDATVESSAQSETVLTLEKIHPIIVQFESNTLALFNSENYLNFSALDNSQSTYPEVPSVFLLQDISFYTKGFDELFGALREMFGATIGDDAEITMEFDSLELFLHEDNLLSKSISLSDLMDLYIRLSKQDGNQRPDPLYIVLSTQARFTKRYSELLTAAGEGKGLSQVCTYSSTDEVPAANDLPEGQTVPTKVRSAQNENDAEANAQPITASKVDEPKVNSQSKDEVSPQQLQAKELTPSFEGTVAAKDAGDKEEEVEVAAQEYIGAGQGPSGEEDGEEEELLPAEGDEEQVDSGSTTAHLHTETLQEEFAEQHASERPPVGNIDPTVEEPDVEEAIEDAAPGTKHSEGEYDSEREQDLYEQEAVEGAEEAEVEVEAEEDFAQKLIEGANRLEAKEVPTEVASSEQNSEVVSRQARGESPDKENFISKVGVSARDTPSDFAAEHEEQYQSAHDAPVIVDTVYNTRNQSFAAEELLDYEEEEGQLSPFSEISDEGGQAGEEEDHDFAHDPKDEDAVQDQDDREQFPTTALASPHETGIDGDPDEDSFSSATVVGARDVSSPAHDGASPLNIGTGGSQSSPKIDSEQHHIQVYQYEEEEASADYDDAEREEIEGLGSYVVQEGYEYNEGTWEGDETGDFLQEESYYTAIDHEEYVEGQYEEQDPSTVLIQAEETGEGSTGENYEAGEENVEYPDEEGYDEGAYEEYPDDEEGEVADYEVSHGVQSPNVKRHREEETDALDVQDIKRTRSN